MGILFDEHLCSVLIISNCQESRLTGRWSLVFAALFSDCFLACPFLWISCLPLHAAFFSLSWPCYSEVAHFTDWFQGFLLYWEQWRDQSREGTQVFLLPEAVPHSLFRGTPWFPLRVPVLWAAQGQESSALFLHLLGCTGLGSENDGGNILQDSGMDQMASQVTFEPCLSW